MAVQALASFELLAACNLCAKAASSALTPNHLIWLKAVVIPLDASNMLSAHVMSLTQGACCNSLIVQWCFLVTALLAYTRKLLVGLLKEVYCPVSLPFSMFAFLPAKIFPCRRQCKQATSPFKLFS